MNSSKKIWVALVAVAIVALVGWFTPVIQTNLAGITNYDQVDAADGFSVDGTTVINGSGVVTGTSGTFSSTLGVTGEFTSREGTTALTASTTLTAADSGKTFYAGTANLQITLPVPTDGVWYRVVVSGNFATTNMIVQGPASDATDDKIYGALEVAGAVVACSAEDTVSFVNTAELPGDFITLRSEGTNWYVTGQGTTAGSITCTDAD